MLSDFSLLDQKPSDFSLKNPKLSDFGLSDPKSSDFIFSDSQPSKFIFSNSLAPLICIMARFQSTGLPSDARVAYIIPVNQAHGNYTAVVNPIGTEERRVVNRKLVLHTPTLGSEPDAYHANVHCATVSTLMF